ncbi:unnamed protein product [Rotaria sordida]|uniref:PiggyBac transposable element-derived protein domain-containing protein n=1 Tax=Rotaria sordida TaxID=392033 RepID=A0A819HAL6_9BILA|nr:unnamed protein product [Rotaria sordida]
MSDEEPSKRRPKHEPALERPEVRIFSPRSGRQWTTEKPPKRKVAQANITKQRSGVGRPATNIQIVKEAFQLLIMQEMTLLLIRETNRRAHLVIRQWNDQNPGKEHQWKETDSEEIWGFIGILILAGVYRSKNEDLYDLWSTINGRPIFQATMTKNRFKSLLHFCRFDNITIRDQRLKEDILAPIRDLWVMFLAQLFSFEDCISSICRIDYDSQLNSFISFSSPLIDGMPQPNFFQTENFDELKMWFSNFNRQKFNNIYMVQSIVPSAFPLILSVYRSDNKFTATDILKRWLYIYNQRFIQGMRVIGFSSDGDLRYLRTMRLCIRFFVELPNLNLFKHNDNFYIKIPEQWSWFFMKEQQILLFMQEPIHVATKFRNRLLSEVASMKIGDYSIDIQHLMNLIQLKNKLEHNLIKCDVSLKDRQNFASCRRISSETVLKLLNNNENYKRTYVYLSLLHLIITGLIDKSTKIEERLYNIWIVVFTCRV